MHIKLINLHLFLSKFNFFSQYVDGAINQFKCTVITMSIATSRIYFKWMPFARVISLWIAYKQKRWDKKNKSFIIMSLRYAYCKQFIKSLFILSLLLMNDIYIHQLIKISAINTFSTIVISCCHSKLSKCFYVCEWKVHPWECIYIKVDSKPHTWLNLNKRLHLFLN